MKATTIILFPTGHELETAGSCFPVLPDRPQPLPETVYATVSGVGMAETAASVIRALAFSPGMLILAGIAGAYQGAGLSVGDIVWIRSETISDLGAYRGEGEFRPLYGKVYSSPYPVEALPSACSATVNAACRIGEASTGIEIENMEGAAFFACCLAAGVRFAEIRAVSNLVGEPRDAWQVEPALGSLSEALKKVVYEVNP